MIVYIQPLYTSSYITVLYFEVKYNNLPYIVEYNGPVFSNLYNTTVCTERIYTI